MSPSRASDFMQCPLLYRFRVIDKLPESPSAAASRGTLVHSVLERIFDVEAPGFRAATAWGVIIGVVLAIGVGYFIWRYRRRGRQLREIKHPTTTDRK